MWLLFNFILSNYYQRIIFRSKHNNHNELINKIETLLNINFFFFNGKLVSPNLELKIKKIAKEVLVVNQDFNISPNNKVLHIGTVFHNTGGHSRVVLNWVNNDKDRVNHVLLTRQNEENEMVKSFNKDNLFILKRENDIIKKSQELVDFLSNNQYEFVVLHNHWYDTIPFLALSMLPKQKVIFYNHTDHCATFGTSFSNLVVEIGPKSSLYSIKYRNILNSKYLPMPLSYEYNNETIKERESFVSIASPYKYEPFEKYNFYYDSNILFNRFKNFKLSLIGVDKRDVLNLENIHVEKFVFNPIDYYKKSQFYLDSYPVGSGLSMLDAVSFGCIPIFNKTAVTIYNQGSRWFYNDNETPKILVLNSLKERIVFFDKINNNEIDIEELSNSFRLILLKHFNPIWQTQLNEIYNEFNYEKCNYKKSVKTLYHFKVAKFCTVNNMTQYKEYWKYLLQHVYGIEYHALNSIYKLICKIKK